MNTAFTSSFINHVTPPSAFWPKISCTGITLQRINLFVASIDVLCLSMFALVLGLSRFLNKKQYGQRSTDGKLCICYRNHSYIFMNALSTSILVLFPRMSVVKILVLYAIHETCGRIYYRMYKIVHIVSAIQVLTI